MQNYWWLLAMFLSLLTSAYVYANQLVKVKGSLLMIYRGIGTGLVLLPFCVFFAPIHNVAFYALCLTQGLVISFGDNRILNASKTFGAEVTSLIHPLSIFFIFLFWIVLHPSDFAAFTNHPLKFALIIFCLLGVMLAIIRILKARGSKKALGFLIISMMCEIFIDVTNKETTHLGAENIVSAIYYYTLITSLVAGGCNLGAYVLKNRKLSEIICSKNLKFAWFFILYAAIHSALKTYTMYLTPNPAYVAAIVHAYPVWILAAENLRPYLCRDTKPAAVKINPRWLGVLLVSIVCLILAVE